ncbi:glycerate kinase [Paenibacillus darwinianus]|uniref:Glycerate kinase n=1 Tax=Paenibacillus darwinianus TaxID=1380763 RepID=A0A9W5RZM8_9BACL|nr:glycerate kinase [Paenibacillus darwinianus]EXX87000.1 glycerate kinase [Paenibacillus darwinianus]EXX87157.1 glycerate kinase [Paenibacillus darwinianus]EXX87304.1 glycerate kinase [Paenibacillus darwinianus]
MKFVIAPDSFKGTLTAAQAGAIIARTIMKEMPEAEATVVPMADGGEGTVDALVQATGGTIVEHQASGPEGEPRTVYYGEIGEGMAASAVLEAANVFGLPLLPPERRNPLHTTSRGLGELMRALLDKGYRQFVVGLGGSSTNDGGIGMLSALGARFTDRDGNPLEGFGRDLPKLTHADLTGLDSRLKESRMTVACDVTNPLLGPQGASHIFGPQKGASPELVARLDEGMARYAALMEQALSLHLRERPGAGAAGGLGFAFMSIGSVMVPGAEVVEQLTGLKRKIAEADWVITGEGRSDEQTVFGKLPWSVAGWANDAGKPAILISGSLGTNAEALYDRFAACFSTVPGPSTLEACMEEAERNLEQCARNVIRLLARART